MEKILLIYGDDCVKCHTLKPHIKRFCEDNGYELEEIRYEDYEEKDNITALPTLIVKWEESDKFLTDDDLILFITNK